MVLMSCIYCASTLRSPICRADRLKKLSHMYKQPRAVEKEKLHEIVRGRCGRICYGAGATIYAK